MSFQLCHLAAAHQRHILILWTGSQVLEQVGDVGVEVIPAQSKVLLLRPHHGLALKILLNNSEERYKLNN